MKGSQTLTEALALVPEYFPLTPLIDKFKKGDKIYDKFGHDVIIKDRDKPVVLDEDEFIAVREIPQDIRKAEAFWSAFYKIGRELNAGRWRMCDLTSMAAEMNQDHIESLGGFSYLSQMLTEGPGAIWRWVEENRK